MSVSTELTKLQNNLSSAYKAFTDRGYNVPLQKSMNNLSSTIGTTLDSLGSQYAIQVSEYPNMTVTVQAEGQNTQTQTTTGYQTLKFNLSGPGTYTVTTLDSTETQVWQKTVIISKSSTVSVTGREMLNMTAAELHNLCLQGEFVSKLFTAGVSRWKFTLDSTSILNNYVMLVQDFEYDSENNRTAIRFCTENNYSGANYSINPYIYYAASSSATSFSNTYSSNGSWKYCVLRNQFLSSGSEIYNQAQSLIPDDSSLTTGIKFSGLKYSDTQEQAKIYKYVGTSDTFTEQTSWVAPTQASPLFYKGYFYQVGTLTQEEFDSGYWYTYASNVYTAASSYSSSQVYFGFYETLQEDGIFYKALKSLDNAGYLQTMELKQGTGGGNYTAIQTEYDKVTINSTSETFGWYIQTGWTDGVTRSIRYYGDPIGSNSKLKGMCYDYDADSGRVPNAMTTGSTWFRSQYAITATSFVCIYYFGPVTSSLPYNAIGVRPSFKFL